MLAADIVAVFPYLGKFFACLTAALSRPQRAHLQQLVAALALCAGAHKTFSALARISPQRAACSRKRFVTAAPWDDLLTQRLLWQQVCAVIPRRGGGGRVHLIIQHPTAR